MRSTRPAIFILASVVLAVLWTRTPAVHRFDLQFASIGFLIYLGIRARRARRAHDFLPSGHPLDFPILSFFTLVLVAGTGGIQSPALSLVLVLAFFGIRILKLDDLLAYAVAVPLFFLATPPGILANREQLTALLLLSLCVLLTLLVKVQQDSLQNEKQLNAAEEENRALAFLFFQTVLLPKLHHLSRLAEYPEDNQEVILLQIELLKTQTAETLQELKSI